MNSSKIKTQIKHLAGEFDLRFNGKWFKYLWISKRHARYLEYIGMCTDPLYTRFGKTVEKRIQNIDKFEGSKEFRKIKDEFSGQAITKKEVIKGIKDCKKIEDAVLRRELLNLHNKILSNLSKGNLALLTATNNQKEKEVLLSSYLKHEWIHHLLIKNKIYFKSLSEKFWKYDEGLVTYFEYYSDNKLNKLKPLKEKTKYSYFKEYFIYAIKFKKLLKDKKTPKERKTTLLNLMQRVK